MINDLYSLARAREREIRQQVRARQELPRRGQSRRRFVSRMARRAVGRLGSSLVTIGKRLECYELRLTGESDYARG